MSSAKVIMPNLIKEGFMINLIKFELTQQDQIDNSILDRLR